VNIFKYGDECIPNQGLICLLVYNNIAAMAEIAFACNKWYREGHPTGPAEFTFKGYKITEGMEVQCVDKNCPSEISSSCSRKANVVRRDYSSTSAVPTLDWAGSVEPTPKVG